MYLSDDQMAAVVGTTASSFVPVVLPTGRQNLPEWVRGAHVDWMNGCANAPTLTVKVRGNVRQWDGMVWSKVNDKCYMARHADGRAEVLYHDGGVFRAMAWRIFAGDEPVTYRWTVAEPMHGETMEQAATREAQKHLDLVKSHGGKTMQSYLAPHAHAADSVLEDAARYRWLRDEGFTFADVDLGTDSDGDDFVAYRIRFHLPEPAHSKFEDDDWTGPDIDAAIDAAMKAGGAR